MVKEFNVGLVVIGVGFIKVDFNFDLGFGGVLCDFCCVYNVFVCNLVWFIGWFLVWVKG